MGLLICSIAHAETAEIAPVAAEEGITIINVISWLFWLCILVGPSIYMFFQLKKEKERAWNPLTPDDADNSAGVIRSEFEEYNEWLSQLKEFSVKGETQKLITTGKQLNQGFDLLAKLSALPNLNNPEKELLNRLGAALNMAQERYHVSSLWSRILVTLMYTLLFGIWPLLGAYLACTAETFEFTSFVSCLFGFAIFVAYIIGLNYADMRPAYKFVTDENSFTIRLRRALSYAKLQILTNADREFDTMYYDVYEDINGKKWAVARPFEGVFNAIAIWFLLFLFVLPIGYFIMGGINFLSNYIIKK